MLMTLPEPGAGGERTPRTQGVGSAALKQATQRSQESHRREGNNTWHHSRKQTQAKQQMELNHLSMKDPVCSDVALRCGASRKFSGDREKPGIPGGVH